jgi:hypothetical protein
MSRTCTVAPFAKSCSLVTTDRVTGGNVRKVSDQGGGPHGPLARQMCLSIGATLNLRASDSAKVTGLELI